MKQILAPFLTSICVGIMAFWLSGCTTLRKENFANHPKVSVGYVPCGMQVKSNVSLPEVTLEESEPPVIMDIPAAQKISFDRKLDAGGNKRRYPIPGGGAKSGRIKGSDYQFKDWFSDNYLLVMDLSSTDRKKFPSIYKALDSLKRILRERPLKNIPIPEFPESNSALSFEAKPFYIDAAWGSGCGLLTQFTVDGWNRANNKELIYYFQGLSRDGRYYVTASFSVGHPKLPVDVYKAARMKQRGDYIEDEIFLNAQSDQNFVPSLDELQKLLRSIQISD